MFRFIFGVVFFATTTLQQRRSKFVVLIWLFYYYAYIFVIHLRLLFRCRVLAAKTWAVYILAKNQLANKRFFILSK